MSSGMSPEEPRRAERPSGRDLALRLAAVAVFTALGAYGLASPGSVLAGGAAWLGFLFFAASGWGYLVARAIRTSDVDLGLRIAWGLAAFLAVAGVLLAFGTAARASMRFLLALGWAGAAWREWASASPAWRCVHAMCGAARQRPALALLAGALGAVALFRVIAGAASLEHNVWDDDVGYLPLLERLVSIGDLNEPFSFRRMGAYGGQLLLQGLAAARGTTVNVNLIDEGLGFGLVLLLLVGHVRGLPRDANRGGRALPLALVTLLFLLLPDVGNNTASHFTGVLFFLALYRTTALFDRAAHLDGRVAARWLALAALTGAAAGTLRQNYLAVVSFFFFFALASRLATAARAGGWAAAWRAERRFWILAIAIGVVALIPWWIAAFASNHTFLFPFLGGTWNHGLTLKPSALTWAQELGYLAYAAIESEPLAIVAPLALLLLFARDRRASRPLSALFFATVASFLLLVHAFVGSDFASLWRYAFGAGLALTAIFVVEACHLGGDDDGDAEGDSARPVALPALGRWVLLAAVLLQLFVARQRAPQTYVAMAKGIDAALSVGRRGDPVARAERQRYRAMQAAIPAGQPVAVMLDDAAHLDYARNPIANLDTPGYSSLGAPGEQLPSFAGPEAVRRYFTAHGYRYLSFVRPDFSRYFYRRWYWLRELYLDVELFQVMAAYTLDAIESFTALAASAPPLYDHEGLVVVDLGPPTAPPVRLPPEEEPLRRATWLRGFAKATGMEAAWALSPRPGLVFSDGVSGLAFLSDADLAAGPALIPRLEAVAKKPTANDPHGTMPTGTPVRWLHRRLHLRLRADRPMVLTLRGQVRREVTGTRPRLTFSLDGELLASQVVAEDGRFEVQLPLSAAQLAEWSDLYAVFSSVGVPERDSRDLRFARLDFVGWETVVGREAVGGGDAR